MQREAERLVDDELAAHTGLCDRGTIDGEAYWPGSADEYWSAVGTARDDELARYLLVVHLRTPTLDSGYNHANAARTEDAAAAHEIDERIYHAWDGHHNRVVIEPQANFEDKLHTALEAIRPHVPARLRGA